MPTEADWKGLSKDFQPYLQSTEVPGSALCIVRERLNPRYGNLINYLANAQWQEADNETLKVMLDVANRTEQGYLGLDDIKTFPCKDLQLIDHLWLKFSGGHFGFSVQKEIYLQCGGQADYEYYKEAEQRWGDRVGWREGGSWTFEIIYELVGSPEGHLPVESYPWLKRRGFLGGGGILSWWR